MLKSIYLKQNNPLLTLIIFLLINSIILNSAFAQGNIKKMQLKSLIHYPKDYDSDSIKKWPLILFLHGMAERGENIESIKIHGIPKITELNEEFPFVTISPQCPMNYDWREDKMQEKVISLLESFLINNKIDKKRIYISGISMGGYGTWGIIIKRPDLFAAAIPICGGGDPLKIQGLKTLPIWVFHGEDDSVIPASESIQMVESINKIGGNVKFTLYPNVDHDSWTKTYKNKKIYDWLLTHSQKN